MIDPTESADSHRASDEVARSERDALEQLTWTYRPLVVSVCRRYLRRPEDVEDAVQDTFVKLARRRVMTAENVAGWLAAAAYSGCVDLIRRTGRERRRREGLARVGAPADPQLAFRRDAIRARVNDALLELDDATRELVVDRFYRGTPLRVIAERTGASVPTISRRSTAALSALAEVLSEMGIEDVDALAVADCFGGEALVWPGEAECAGLRFAPDWESPQRMWADASTVAATGCPLPGWSRPMRVGMLVSWRTIRTPTVVGYLEADDQVQSLRALSHPGLRLVGVAEPGSTHHGSIERALRDYELTGGLIDASSAAELSTLDVIVIGNNFDMTDDVARAIADAVRGGVGLLNEFWTGQATETVYSAAVRELLLAKSPIFAYHAPPGCGLKWPGTVVAEHASLLPGLTTGTVLPVSACGPAYVPQDDARVMVMKNKIVQPHEHRLPALGPLPMPGYLLGQLGNGRVAVVHCWPHPTFAAFTALRPGEYLVNLLNWLANHGPEPTE